MEHQRTEVPVRQRLAVLAEAADLLVTAVEGGGLDHLDARGMPRPGRAVSEPGLTLTG